MTAESTGRVRVGFVVLWTAIGLGLLLAATWLIGGWGDPTFWSSVLVNLGTTIFLAGFLVWLERRFVATARTVARDAATAAASEAATLAAEEATRELSERLDAIQKRFEDHWSEQVALEDATVASLRDEISYDRVMDALVLAHAMGAASFPLYVTAGDSIDHPVVGISLTYEDVSPYESREPEVIGITLSVDTSNLEMSYAVEAEWSSDDDPVAVLGRLRAQMISVGLGPESQRLEFDEFFANLRLGLEEAVAGRRGDASIWRTTGGLRDVVSRDWVISENGIEHREHGLVAKRHVFSGPRARPGNPFEPPPTPDWADEETWTRIAARARRRLRSVIPWGV